MKAHIGADVKSGLVHTVTTTAANVADVVEVDKLLLHGHAVRSKLEHPFRVVKRQFGYHKVRFKQLAKNTAQILEGRDGSPWHTRGIKSGEYSGNPDHFQRSMHRLPPQTSRRPFGVDLFR